MKISAVAVVVATITLALASVGKAQDAYFAKFKDGCETVAQKVTECNKCVTITDHSGGYDAVIGKGTISLWNNDDCTDDPHHEFVVNFKSCETTGWKSVMLNCEEED
ncbi:hypothetical protein GQ42DRAFT_156401 [Ramicandelaber brevisporus]|nr:hypothetical protein GQ42DRAFT_156401 [Ramicandelaber brevisporus]